MLLCPLVVYFIYSVSYSKENNELYGDILTLNNKSTMISNKVPLFFCILVFGYFIFWIGMRTYVADTTLYIVIFNNRSLDFSTAWAEIDWEGKGPGFEIFSVIFKSFISADSQWWLMTIAIVCGLAIMKILREYSVNFFYSSFLFIAMLTFSWMMNGMRQFICVSLLFLCCNYIRDGKFVKYFIVILLLSTIHTTVWLMLPIYFVVRCKPWSSKIALFIGVILLICLFAEPFFAGMDDVLQGTNYSGITQQMQEDDGVNPLRVAFYAIIPILSFWRKDELEKNKDKFKILNICINMSLVTAALYLVGMVSSGILIGRLPIYCEVYNLLLIPFILKYGFDKQDRNIVTTGYTLILIAYFFLTFDWYYCSNITGYVF